MDNLGRTYSHETPFASTSSARQVCEPDPAYMPHRLQIGVRDCSFKTKNKVQFENSLERQLQFVVNHGKHEIRMHVGHGRLRTYQVVLTQHLSLILACQSCASSVQGASGARRVHGIGVR